MSNFTYSSVADHLHNVSLELRPPSYLRSPPSAAAFYNDSSAITELLRISNSSSNITVIDMDSEVDFDDLYRVLVSCFVIILFGYMAGRTGLITSSQAAGIGTFVSKFSLPALLLKNMIELNFSTVNWMFLVSVLIAKGSIFILVVGITLLVKHPINLGLAGIFGIFATQSNDFAVGYPILQALYGKSHSEYLNYLYLVAPVSLVLLNPIGFTMLEIHKNSSRNKDSIQSKEGDPKKSEVNQALGRVVKGIVTNPIILMTFLGIIGHFVFRGTVPSYIDDILKVLGQSYNATALFLLGLSMVGKIKSNLGISLLVPILLILAKMIILPLVTWEVVGSLVDSNNGSYSLSMYGFIYGAIPTTPSVFLYASLYDTGVDVIARGIVLGTFLSAPIMFASGKMMTIVVTDDFNHKEELTDVCFDTSIVSLIASIWVLAVFIFGKKWRMIPHRFTFALIASQLLSCTGMILYYSLARNDPDTITHFPIIILLLVGIFSSRVWTALISVIMCLILTRSLCSVLRYQVWFWFIGWGVPIFLTGVIFMVGRNSMVEEVDPTFHFGVYQTVVSASLLSVCIVVTITSIMVWQRKERKEYLMSVSETPSQSSPQRAGTSHGTFDECEPLSNGNDIIGNQAYGGMDEDGVPSYPLNKAPSIEDLIPRDDNDRENRRVFTHSSSSEISQDMTERTCLINQCSAEQRHRCIKQLKELSTHVNVQEEVVQDEFQVQKNSDDKLKEEYQTSHHLVLLLVLLLSMFVGLFLCAWRLVHSENSGIYLEIEFLDSFLNYGQGLAFLAVFGFDTKLFLSPLIRRIKQWVASSEMFGVPKSVQQDRKTKDVCRQFTQFHQENCIRDIVKNYRVGKRLFKNLFCGTEFCDWLLEAGLAKDKDGAIDYGRHLLLGKVICHVTGQQHFQNAPYYYRFVDNEVENSC